MKEKMKTLKINDSDHDNAYTVVKLIMTRILLGKSKLSYKNKASFLSFFLQSVKKFSGVGSDRPERDFRVVELN